MTTAIALRPTPAPGNTEIFPAADLEEEAAADAEAEPLAEAEEAAAEPDARALEIADWADETADAADDAAEPVAEAEVPLPGVPVGTMEPGTAAHSSCWSARPACTSAAVQLVWRHAPASSWNWTLVQRHVTLVRPQPAVVAAVEEQPRMQLSMPAVVEGAAALALPEPDWATTKAGRIARAMAMSCMMNVVGKEEGECCRMSWPKKVAFLHEKTEKECYEPVPR